MSLQTSDEEHHGSAMLYLRIETSSLKFYLNGTLILFDPSILVRFYCLIVICCIALTSFCNIWIAFWFRNARNFPYAWELFFMYLFCYKILSSSKRI